MKNNIKDIYFAFDGKLAGNKRMKINVCETLAQMPKI